VPEPVCLAPEPVRSVEAKEPMKPRLMAAKKAKRNPIQGWRTRSILYATMSIFRWYKDSKVGREQVLRHAQQTTEILFGTVFTLGLRARPSGDRKAHGASMLAKRIKSDKPLGAAAKGRVRTGLLARLGPGEKKMLGFARKRLVRSFIILSQSPIQGPGKGN
jgi:hypothetical protein